MTDSQGEGEKTLEDLIYKPLLILTCSFYFVLTVIQLFNCDFLINVCEQKEKRIYPHPGRDRLTEVGDKNILPIRPHLSSIF